MEWEGKARDGREYGVRREGHGREWKGNFLMTEESGVGKEGKEGMGWEGHDL